MTWFSNLTIRIAIGLVFIVCFLAPVLLIDFLTIRNQRQLLTAELKADLERTAQVLTLGLQESVWSLVPETGEQLVDAVMTDSRILRIWIDSDEGPFIRRAREGGVDPDAYTQSVQRPILYHNVRIGQVIVDIDRRPMEAIIAKQRNRYLLISMGAFLIGALILLWVLNRKIMLPVTRLLHQSEDLAVKKLDRQFVWTQRDEMGTLGKSFEHTRQSLAVLFLELEQNKARAMDQAEKLKQVNENLQEEVAERLRAETALIEHQEKLEEIIQQRTLELTRSNQELKQEINDRQRAEADRRTIEIKLQRAEKMEALGTLAGGVAHDLNNILSGIVSYPELLLMDLPHDSPLYGPLQTIQKSGERAAIIVQDLLTLARRGVATTKELDLVEVVSDYLISPEHIKLIESKPGITVKTEFNAAGLAITGSQVHITKMIMNLVANAAEAIPESGSIRVAINPHQENKGDAFDAPVQADACLVLSIEDSGVGIHSKDLKQVFEPFYTTKVMGKSGSGLGMAVVWGTVQDHNGQIDIQSTVGRGTTVTIKFPATRLTQPAARHDAPHIIDVGNATILVVDDVAEQRLITSAMLKKLGYCVTTADSGEAAVDMVAKRNYDLLIVDMIMDPGIDGLETYRRCIEINPHQRAVIASGYSRNDRIKQAQQLGFCLFIKKPFLIGALQKVVCEALGAPADNRS